MTYYLKAEPDTRNFNNKATVTFTEGGARILTSYTTDVARIDSAGNFARLWNGYSATTLRHVNEFRQQAGLPKLTAKEWRGLPVGA